MTEVKKNTKRIMGLDIVRFMAVFFVISVHFMLNNHFYEAPMEGAIMFIMMGMRWLFYICVPLFILLTGYLKSNKKPNKEYYKSIIPVLASYGIISILAILVRKFLFSDPASMGHLIHGIFNFTTIGYAWYVEMYIGLFLLIPFLNILYKNIDTKKNKQILLLTFALLVSVPLMVNAVQIGNIALNVMPDWWTILYPVLYYFIGCYIKEYQIKMSKLINGIAIVTLLFLETFIAFFYYQGRPFDSILLEGYGSLLTVILATLVFLFFYNVDFKNKFLRIMITDFSKLSFDIYLLSYLVDIYFYTTFAKYIVSTVGSLPYYLLFVPTIFLTCYIIAFIKRCIIDGIFKLKNSSQ